MAKRVGVLVVDDSLICRQIIVEALSKDPELEVVGTCADGQEALRQVRLLRPDVITMDVDMPVMDGLTAVERIMAEVPTPILMLTGDPRNQAPELTCKALELGALSLEIKPSLNAAPQAWKLAQEVKLLASVKVIRHLRGARGRPAPAVPSALAPRKSMESVTRSPVGVVALAGSTGAPQVIHRLLKELPGDFAAPIVLVQHINPSFAESLAGWLAASSKLTVRLAKDGDALIAGRVLVAPPGKHLVIAEVGRVELRFGEPEDGHLPSGTALLRSAAAVYGRRAAGVVLTGMGSDGADGLAAIRLAGGRTFAQSQDSCVVFGMPGFAIALGAAEHVVHADDLAAALVRLVQ